MTSKQLGWQHSFFFLFSVVIQVVIGAENESRSVLSSSLRSPGLYSPWNSPSQNTGVGSLFHLQGIFPMQGANPGLLRYLWILYQLSHKGSPRILEWVAYPLSSGSSWPRNWTRVSCIAGRLFTSWATRDNCLTDRRNNLVLGLEGKAADLCNFGSKWNLWD